MSIVRKYIVPLLLLILFISVSSVYGRPGNTHSTVNGPITPWFIPAGQCPSLPAGLSLTGTGERISQTNTRENADGSKTITINDLVVGDAVGSDGSTYHYKYSNHSTENVPASGSPKQVSMTDSFVLNGGAVHVNVGFNWRWTYTTPDEYFPPQHDWEQISTIGDPFLCDPI
jgi:hypothetical protein